MAPKKTVITPTPLLLTHWDPDLYPTRSVPLLHELIIHILAYGEVWLKEVDLFLNPKIRAYLSERSNRDAFASLVETERIKILIPDTTTVLNEYLDPQDQPLLVTALARDGKKPLKSKPWILDDKTRRYCKQLDSILSLTRRQLLNRRAHRICRPRATPPLTNEFATKLHAVLTQSDKTWQGRDPFKNIDEAMVDLFAGFGENHEAALKFLAEKKVVPNATNGFYRSLAYQCADEFAHRTCATPYLVRQRAQAMKNLVQSVYAYCELKREGAAGTYSGRRMAEMPPDKPGTKAYPEVARRIEVVPVLGSIPIPIDANIGLVVSSVLAKCDQYMRVFWNLAGKTPSPEQDFQVAWNHVAEAFANEVKLPRKSGHRVFRPAGLVIGGATLGMGLGGLAGFSWNPKVVAAEVALGAIATYGMEATDLFRSVQMHFERRQIAKAVSGAAAIRCSKIE